MQTTVVNVPATQITDWDSFHAVFKRTLGFPDFYGCNMDAWIDCMTYVDEPSGGMTSIFVGVGELMALRIDDAPDFQRRCPEQYRALVECTAFVNYRRIEQGHKPVLTLLLSGSYKNPD